MHEMSLAQNILEIVRHNLRGNDERSVTSIRVRIGVQAGVVPSSLQFCFEALTKETSLSNSCLEIELIPLVIKCSTCDNISHPDSFISTCLRCGSKDIYVASGAELEIIQIDVEDTPQEQS